MVLSKRERLIVWLAGVAVAILVTDRYLVSPFLTDLDELGAQRRALDHDLRRADSLVVREKRLRPKWDAMLSEGLSDDRSKTESRILHALRDWSQETGLDLASVKPEHVSRDGELGEIAFQAAGTGTMRAVSGFLWRVETTKLPLRVTKLQLGSRTDGADDLSLQLRMSSLFTSSEDTEAAPSPSTGASGEVDS